jgi:eukaryotic-like serine/threonine-protein kinase
MIARLILKAKAGYLRGQEFVFVKPVHCVLGRSRTCHLQLPADPTVSRQHCLIEMDEHGLWAQDLASLNGTYVNGERIGLRPERSDVTQLQGPRQLLRDGDELRICDNVFGVEVHASTPGTKPHSGSHTGLPLSMCG